MKTEDWQILSTLYATKNLTQTAKLLFMSQPALTKRLQTIEQELGTVIAIRTNKGVTFTPAGEYLAAQAGQFLKLTYETKRHLKSLIHDNTGQIKIGAPGSFTKHFLPGLISGFNQLYPNVTFQVHAYVSSEIPARLEDGTIQIAFMNSDHKHSLKSNIYMVNQAYVISQRPLDFSEIPSLPLIIHYRDEASSSVIMDWWSQTFQTPPNISMIVSDLDTALTMVQNGLGISIVFNNYQKDDYNFFQIPLFHPDGKPLERNTWLLYPEDMDSVPCINRFIEYALRQKS